MLSGQINKGDIQAMEINVSLVVALLSILGTIVTAILFFGKLRWDNQKHETDIKTQAQDLNRIGQKISAIRDSNNNEIKTVLAKIDTVDKSTIKIATTLQHVVEVVNEIKQKVYCE